MIYVPGWMAVATLSDHGKAYEDLVAIEEMSELIKALTKDNRYGDAKDQILEELADVHICLAYIQHSRKIPDEALQNKIIEKVKRYMDREQEGDGGT